MPEGGTRLLSLGFLAEVCWVLGDAERASDLIEHLRPCEGRMLRIFGTAACLGPVDRLLGMLASVAGRADEAERWLDRALELSRRLRSPVWIAHCLYACAAHLGAIDRARARWMLAEAADLCERHGLGGLGKRVEASLDENDRVG